MALQLVHRLDQRHRRAGEAQPPAGHRIGLRAAVHRHGAPAQPRLHLHDGRRLEPVIGELLVDVVGEDPDIRVAQQHVADRPQLVGRVGGAGRVARVVQHEPAGPRRDRLLERLGAQLEAVVLLARHQHRLAVGQRDDVRIADPARARDDDLVVLVQRRQHGIEDHLLAAGRDDDLLRFVVDARVTEKLLRHGLAQHRRAGDIGIVRLVVLDGADRRVLDVARRVEVRFALRERDHVLALGDHVPRLGRDGDGQAGLDAVEAFGGKVHELCPRSAAGPYRSGGGRAIVAAAKPRCTRHTASRTAATTATMTVASA